ncbi:MAG TPA: endolytic transglycosylase MltG [Candidatus Dormibacteraeota bacterium]|nr:endolytic transglycosylase MltG [Candidatus Dormibacteraeota bacterium]
MSGSYPRPPRRGGGGRTFLVGVLAVLVLLGAAGGGGFAYYRGQLRSTHDAGQGTATVVIPPGTSTSGVADILSGKGLIGSTLVFQLYVKLNGFRLEAGQYRVPGGATMEDVVALLSHNQTGAAVTLTIPEGYTAKKIGALAEKKGLFSADAFLAATMKPYPEDFLAGHDASRGLDGYLFPDTYQFSAKATPQEVVSALLKQFGQKLTPDMRSGTPVGFSLAQAVVMASIVEREAFFDKDRAAVAGVFYNRLKAGMPLQSDATVAYAVGRAGADISEADKRADSPYNTYLHTGLPPAAISNPGLPSLQAALSPMQTDYVFYLTDKDGHAHFSKTYAQHQQCQVNLSVCPTLP